MSAGASVSVGVHEDEAAQPHPSGGTVGEVAGVVEFGSEGVAPTAFVRATVDNAEAEIERELADAAEDVARGRAPSRHAFAQIGERLTQKIRGRVPVATGTLRDAISARVA